MRVATVPIFAGAYPDVKQAYREADRYVQAKSSIELRFREFFLEIIERIKTVSSTGPFIR